MIQLAHEQSVLPLVGMALSNAIDIGFPSEKAQSLVARTRNLALSNYIKKGLIMKLLMDFDVAGIKAVLLKGFALADLYAEPNCRISSDADIYIDIKNEKRAYKLLSEHGCKVNPRSPTSHHAVCEHPQMGCIELHVILYDEIVEDVWFGKRNDRQFIQESLKRCGKDDDSYLTLGITDNLIFLTLHMIKHFILSGTSLGQIMDIALYLKNYKTQINIKRFWDILEPLRYRKLMNTVLSALVSHFGFSPEDLVGFEKQDDMTVSALLNDIETGGWLGKREEKERNGSWYRYNRIRYTDKRTTLSYWCYMIRRNAINYTHALLPNRATLERKFPYARITIWLVPIAWIHRLLCGIWKLICGRVDTGSALRSNQATSSDKGRDYLFRLMNMM